MWGKRTAVIFFILVVAGATGCSNLLQRSSDEKMRFPFAEREFRGVWVATVGNIDWPSKPGLSSEEQQHEVITILDTVSALNMNAVIFQVRPQCDALYQSSLEPWSFYLTGEQGKAPEPLYDPLQYWVDEAHKRGIELHAWFNPYRAHLTRGNEITDSSLVRKRPDIAKKINDNMYWLDPAKKETQDHSYAVVMDVVRRYDIDGVHFDDYFYPYNDGKFPDDDSWDEYQKSGGGKSREDWRRSHVNTFIERVYSGIKKEKKHVKFGLSPFGIWRPKNPSSITGYDQYNMLYADARLWLNNGWVDYFTPQLYWPVNQIPQSFPVLLGWWSKENTMGRNLWPGMIISRSRDEKTSNEIFNQIMIIRGMVPNGPGHIHFSMKAFLRDSSLLNSTLHNGPYQRPAIVPASPWLDDNSPTVPTTETFQTNDSLTITWLHGNEQDVFHTIVYYQFNDSWNYLLIHQHQTVITLPLIRTVKKESLNRNGEANITETTERLNAIAVSAVDRMGNESPLSFKIVTGKNAYE
ncbi:MAG: family 10 glycosylhydrolase [Bacteroidetes bacterium]|nr:family 10 glycosylhydrolase [Bacteroidota bacterium]